MKITATIFLSFFLSLTVCVPSVTDKALFAEPTNEPDSLSALTIDSVPQVPTPSGIQIEKNLLYDKYTLTDIYPYKDTIRLFQWDKIRERLLFLDSIQWKPATWAVLQNYRNKNGEAPLVKKYYRNEYGNIADTLGVERYQSVPLFYPHDTLVGERYGKDGTLVQYIEPIGKYVHVCMPTLSEREWFVPAKYLKVIGDTVVFRKAIFVDVTNQNMVTLEKIDSVWYIRSMNPVTTGLKKPPHQYDTPLGLFVMQEKKIKMMFLVDGTIETGGFAPYASRFCNGGYIHGIPVSAPRATNIEYSASLGTTPRSHMCVRTATSHAQFIFDWATAYASVIFVFD
ncbi:MAG: L,D-transpeptidase [Candidatus Azobacteroides sp.]|nr:L,D-transpeptidase [Candidatus Azobacteroides sp.]